MFKIIVTAVVILALALFLREVYKAGTKYGKKISKKNKRK